MPKHTISVHEGADTEDEVAGDAPALTRTYRVISEAGLFKRGQEFPKGSTIELHPDTGAAFIEAGDVEEVSP